MIPGQEFIDGENTMYCMKCGRQLASDVKYCKYCGAKTFYGLKIEEAAMESTEFPALLDENKEKAVLGKKEKSEEQEEAEKNIEYRKTSQINRNMNGEEVLRTDFLYDEEGNISHAVKSYPGGTTENIYYEYECDENGAIVKENQYDESGTLVKESQYDEDGTVIKENQYDENGKLELEYFCTAKEGEKVFIEYSYYDDGQIETVYEQEKGTETTRQIYYFEDGEGYITNEYIRNSEGYVIKETMTDYNAQNEIIQTLVYEYSYDSDGNLSGWKTDGDMYSWSVEHSDGNIVIGTINYNEDGTVQMNPAEGYMAEGGRIYKNRYTKGQTTQLFRG